MRWNLWRRGERPVAKLTIEYFIDMSEVVSILCHAVASDYETYVCTEEGSDPLGRLWSRREIASACRTVLAFRGEDVLESYWWDNFSSKETDMIINWAWSCVRAAWPEHAEEKS